jgi:predicted PurR-regulated permease PerM
LNIGANGIAREQNGVFSLDDRAGNVVTTVALFLLAAAVLYFARGAFLILLLSLFFAYLLEPAVAFVQERSLLFRKNRTSAIAQVYVIGTLVLGGLGYEFGPRLAAQARSLNTTIRELLERLSSGGAGAGGGVGHSLTAAQQLWIRDQLARHQDVIARLFERGATSVAYVAASSIWLFAIPILAIFILRDGGHIAEELIEATKSQGDESRVERILRQIDRMLAKYIRAQLALAVLSFVFYSVSMLVLRFPDAIALGLLGGALEFLPAVGWIVSAGTILTIGFLTHSHWIWMAGLLIVWRLVQDYVNSPRIMGDSLELQPLTVVFALMVGGQVGGIAGVYLAVPAVAVLRIVWLECFSPQNSSRLPSDQPIMQMKR